MIAARTVATQTTVERIYVLGGLRDGGEAYEIFPACTRCVVARQRTERVGSPPDAKGL